MKRPVVIAAVLGLVAVVSGVLISSPTLATSGPLLAAMVAVEWQRRMRGAERSLAERSVLLTVDQIIGGLRSGLSLRRACIDQPGTVGAVPDRLNPMAPLICDLRAGAALTQVASRSALAISDQRSERSAHLVAVTLAVLAGNGGPAIPALQRLRHALAGAEHGRRRAAAESAQASASAGLLIAAPALFASAVAGIDPAAAHLYLYETVGAVCVLAAVVLSWCGWWWMQHAIDRALRGV